MRLKSKKKGTRHLSAKFALKSLLQNQSVTPMSELTTRKYISANTAKNYFPKRLTWIRIQELIRVKDLSFVTFAL